jgi:small subunit ribosomal protein S2
MTHPSAYTPELSGADGEEKGVQTMAVEVDIKQLLEAGVHFGHKTSRWHPKMAPYIHSKRQDAHIIDLTKTVEGLEKALPFLTATAAAGKTILFVATKKQTKELVKQVAESLNQPYVTERWLGGMLTNVNTVSAQVKKLKDLERNMATGSFENKYNKLEIQRFQEEIDELNKKYSGVKDLSGKPGALFLIDVIGDTNAINEAKNLGVPVVALVDTNADPSLVDYVIPANDDAIKGIALILDYVAQAIEAGKGVTKKEKGEEA